MRFLTAGLTAVLLSLSAHVLADPARLDAGMRRHMEEHGRGAHDADARDAGTVRARTMRPDVAAPPAMVLATAHVSAGALDALRARGVEIRSILGDVATLRAPAARLGEIAGLAGVERIETPRRPVRRLDRSVPATRADALRTGTSPANWTGGTGKGVIVGVIDSGLDLTHRDFRNPDGSTRVLEFWNQRADAVGTAPAGADGTALYGALCTQAQIDLALNGATNGCLIPDTDGHGTHVAGIAAGNGQATGNGQASYRFVGVAPEADLMIANSIDPGVLPENAVLDAVAYMTARAKALGRPIVINLSLGSYYGARDGTSAYERGLDNASGPGAILVGAVGNEAQAKIRAVGTLAQGQSVKVGFSVPFGSIEEQLELWYPGANQYDVALACRAFATPVIKAGDSSYAQDTACGAISVTSTDVNPGNGDRQILVTLRHGAHPLVSGAWTLTLIGAAVGADTRFSIVSGETAEYANFTNYTESPTNEILTDTASATRVIAVAAYNTRSQWTSALGSYFASATGAIGDIASFSSRGPRRLCSDTAKCPAAMKPEVAAPGAFVISAYTSRPAWPESATMVEADGVHVAIDGTSMAAPHVAGTIALLLQAKPDLTPEEAKRLLAKTVQGNAYTAAAALPAFTGDAMPPRPNYTWGYGMLDAANALRTLNGAALPAPGWHLLGNALAAPIDVAAVFGGLTAVQSVWKWNAAASGWAFYAPSLDAASLGSYAADKGYAVLSAIAPGEGYWVNLADSATLPLRGGQAYALDPAVLPVGWNLVATGTDMAPAAVNAALIAKQGNPLISLWAWSNAAAQWYFYAPSLEAAGAAALADYAASKGYLDFGAAGRRLGLGVGFWVNR